MFRIHAPHRFAAWLLATLAVLIGLQHVCAAENRVDNYEDALSLAKASGKDIVVYQRGQELDPEA